jgi:hypothetical protein
MTMLVKIALCVAGLGLIAGGGYAIYRYEVVIKAETPHTKAESPARPMTREENAAQWRRIHGSQQDLPPVDLPGEQRESGPQKH